MTTMTTKQLTEMLQQMRDYKVSEEIIAAAIRAILDAGIQFSDK